MRNHIETFCDWLESIPTDESFTQRPEFEFFSDFGEEELLAAEQELVRRLAACGMDQILGDRFIIAIHLKLNSFQNDL